MRRPGAPTRRRTLCRDARRVVGARKRDESDEHRRDLPLRGRARHGRRAAHRGAGSDPLYRRAARVSMGNVSSQVPWTYLPARNGWLDAAATRSRLPDRRDGAARRLRTSIADPRLAADRKARASVIGTEGDGLASDRPSRAATTRCSIPMYARRGLAERRRSERRGVL